MHPITHDVSSDASAMSMALLIALNMFMFEISSCLPISASYLHAFATRHASQSTVRDFRLALLMHHIYIYMRGRACIHYLSGLPRSADLDTECIRGLDPWIIRFGA